VQVLKLYFSGRNSTYECQNAFQTNCPTRLAFCGNSKVRVTVSLCAHKPGQVYVADTVLTILSHLFLLGEGGGGSIKLISCHRLKWVTYILVKDCIRMCWFCYRRYSLSKYLCVYNCRHLHISRDVSHHCICPFISTC
jgi:hypothetical protein